MNALFVQIDLLIKQTEKTSAVRLYSDESEKLEIDVFSAAVNFEIFENSLSEAEQFAKDYIDCEEKEYCRMIDEFNEY